MTAKQVISQFKSSAILCADLYYLDSDKQESEEQYTLPMGYSQEQFNAFLEALDFKIPCPEDLWGTIWFQDGSWARPVSEVDEAGNILSHDWVHYSRPEIPAWLNAQ